MTRDPRGWPCPTGAEMRAIDADAIARLGIPSRTLMESAGRAVADTRRVDQREVTRLPGRLEPLLERHEHRLGDAEPGAPLDDHGVAARHEPGRCLRAEDPWPHERR